VIEPFPSNIAPREVSVENGFSSISPGERIVRSIDIDAKSDYEFETGVHYKLQLPRGHITWWKLGSLEVSFVISPLMAMQLTRAQAYAGVKVGLLDKGENPFILIPHSNAIDVKVEA
jgi:hypothetical protein